MLDYLEFGAAVDLVVAVACHVEEWIVENLAAAYIDLGVFKVHLGVLVAESDEVG